MSHTDTHHSFSIEVAMKYGVEKAILIHHFQHWIKLNRRKKSKKHFNNNKWWTYQTHTDIHDFLPYLTEREIKHLVDQLTNEDKVLIKGNFNKSAIDKTTWYAFQDEEKFLGKDDVSNNDYERQICPSTDKNGCPSDKFVSPIPDPKPDTKSLAVCVPEALPGKIKKFKSSGSPLEIDQSEFFRKALIKNKDWTTSELQQAWDILDKYEGPVNDWFRFVESIIDNIRKKDKIDALKNMGKTKGKKSCIIQADPNAKITPVDRDTLMRLFPGCK